MPTNITIDNAVGTELVIPEAGAERRGEITITANHGFFKVTRTDTYSNNFLKSHKLTNAGATIHGNLESNINNGDFIYENLPSEFKGVRAINENEYYRVAYGGGGNYNISGSQSKVIKHTVFNENLNCIRVNNTNSCAIQKPDFASLVSGELLKFIGNFYIESDNLNSEVVLYEFPRVLELYRDGYKLWDDDNSVYLAKQAYPNSYVIPVQEWVKITIDMTITSSNYGLYNAFSNLKLEDQDGVHTGLVPDTSYPSINDRRNLNLGVGSGQTDDDHILYSPQWFIPYGNMVRILNTDIADEIYSTMTKRVTPID